MNKKNNSLKKKNLVIRNIKYFIPLLLKISPMTILMTILISLLNSAMSFLYIIFPAKIIEELMGEKSLNVLTLYVLILIGSTLLINILRNLFESINAYYSWKASIMVDKMLNDKVALVDYFNIEDPVFIDSLDKAKKAMKQYTNGIYTFVYTFQSIITSVITVSGIIGIIISSQIYWIIPVAILGIISNIVIYQKVQNNDQKFRVMMARVLRRSWYYNNRISDFRTQKELRLYNGIEMINDITTIENNNLHNQNMKHHKKNGILYFIDTTVMLYMTRLCTILVLGAAALGLIGPAISIATVTMLFASVQSLDNYSTGLVYSLQEYIKACEYQSDFIDIMEKQSVFKNGRRPIETIENIEFRNVSFKYPRTEKYILNNVSFKIDNKEKISLVGINGSGKTTMIKLICRFFEVDEGEILINGININEYDYEQYMKRLSIVFQDFKIISFNVKSNVAIIDDNQDKLYDCFKRAQVFEKIMSLPNKEYTYINKWFDKNGVEFSGGEMQKFALARALYKDSEFVVLDEPTSALDPLAEAEIYYHFNDVIGKKLTLFISHRLSSCIFSDKILVLDGAKITESGTHNELIKKPDGLYAKMFATQAEYYKKSE